jgi:hypothetical protein
VEQLWDDLAAAYQHGIVATGREPQFLVLVAFLATFLLVRAMTHAIRSRQTRLLRNVQLGGVHVHHLVPGIFLLLTTGYLAIALGVQSDRRLVAVLYGIGAALTLDEFALWLNLRDVYWTEEGRLSIDAVIVAATGLILVGPEFWREAGRAVGRLLSGS